MTHCADAATTSETTGGIASSGASHQSTFDLYHRIELLSKATPPAFNCERSVFCDEVCEDIGTRVC